MPAAEATDVMTYEKKEVSSRGSPSSVVASNLDKMAAVCGTGSGASPPFASCTSGHQMVEQQSQAATSSSANQVAGNGSPPSTAPDASAPTANRFSIDQQRQHPLGGATATFIIPAPSVATGNTSRSSISTVDSEGRVGASALRMSKRWTTLETAGRLLLSLSIAFLIAGVVLTAVGFAAAADSTTSPGFLTMKILGPVCLATTAVMWVLGGAFSRLWRSEWRRRQQAMELRARVQLHALAMDLLKKPILSPRIMQDPVLRRQMLVKLRQQSAMDASSETASTRRSSRLVEPPLVSMATPTSAAAARRHRDSVISAILRQEIERRKSLKDAADGAGAEKLTPAAALAAAAAAFELPGIHISRIETMDIEDDDVVGSSRGGGSGRGHSAYYGGGGGGGGLGSRRFIIIESDLSSGDFSQLSFTSEYSLNGNGSRSSRSRSSRASSNVSSRLWDFSPRESEWDADVSHGSRESQLSSNAAISKSDWSGGPSYGDCYNSSGGGAESRPPQYLHRGGGRDYSLLSPAMPRKSSVVTFDVGEPGVRRHSSPVPPARRRSIVNSASSAATSATAGSGSATSAAGQGSVPASALKYRNVVVSGPSLFASGAGSTSGGSSLAASGCSRFLDDYRTLTQFRKRSAGDQSIISIRIDEDDSGEELEERCQLGIDEEELMLDDNDDVNDRRRKNGNCHGRQGRQDIQDDELDEEYDDDEDTDERTPLNGGGGSGNGGKNKAASRSISNDSHVTRSPEMTPQQQEELLKKRRSSMKRNNTDDSDVARRVERIFDEIDLSVTDSVDESTTRLMTSHDSADTPSGLTIGEGEIGRIDIDTPTRQHYGKIPSCTVTSDTGAHSRTVVFYSPSSSPTRPNCPLINANSSSCSGGSSNQSKQSVAAVGKGAADTRPMTSSAGRKFHLLSSIPRAIFSLERRTLGGGSGGGSAVGSKKDESQNASAQSTTSACGGSPASHKSHRLLFRLGIGDDSSGKS